MKRLQYIVLCGLLLLAAACEKDTLPMNFSPALTTGAASDIFRVGATLSGSIQKSDGVVVKDCGILISELQSMAEYTEIKTASTENTFEVPARNLEPGKKYYYCAYASSGYSIARGEIKEFTTTDSNAPVFSELAVNGKDEKSFTVATTILDEGGSDLILCGFCWKSAESSATEPTVEDNVSNVSKQSTGISTRIKDLVPNKEYQVRAYGINARGVGYGKTITVVTNNATVPAVSSITPGDSTAVSISVKASILSAGESAISEIGFCWSSESKEPTTSHLKQSTTDQLNNANFIYTLDKLVPETTYYIRAYAINGQGTGYGDVFVYTTPKSTVPGIYSLQDLKDYRDARNAGTDVSKWTNSDNVVNIYADIDMGTVIDWQPVKYIMAQEVVDGNGHSILNMNLSVGVDSWGFFDANFGIIRNLTFRGRISAAQDASGVNNSGFNGVVSIANYGTISNCYSYVDINVIGKDMYFGGICYQVHGVVENCFNYGDIISTSSAGGIARIVAGEADKKGKIVGCTNYGTLKTTLADSESGNNDIGGIAASCTNGTIINCVNEGKVLSEGNSSSFGGICALPWENSVITNCQNKGEVAGGSFTGGIIGSIQANNVQVEDCQNTGKVTASLAGGICGAVAYYGNVAPLTGIVVSGNKNTGTVTGTNVPGGGICGYLLRIDNTFYFANNVNGGTVDGVNGTDANAIGKDDRDFPLSQ